MAKKRKQKNTPHKARMSRPIKWMNQAVKWWIDIADGWDKLSSGAIKITICMTVLGLVFSPDTTVSALINYGPLIHSTFST